MANKGLCAILSVFVGSFIPRDLLPEKRKDLSNLHVKKVIKAAYKAALKKVPPKEDMDNQVDLVLEILVQMLPQVSSSAKKTIRLKMNERLQVLGIRRGNRVVMSEEFGKWFASKDDMVNLMVKLCLGYHAMFGCYDRDQRKVVLGPSKDPEEFQEKMFDYHHPEGTLIDAN